MLGISFIISKTPLVRILFLLVFNAKFYGRNFKGVLGVIL